MKNPSTQKIILALVALILPMLTRAANVSMTASDGSGTTSMNTVGKWGPDSTGLAALPPQPTNDYFTGPFFIRTPGNGAGITFAGHSLTLQDVSANLGGQGLPYRSILYKGTGGDTIVINNLTNAAGSVLNNGGSGNVTAPVFTGNLWTIAGNSTIISDQGATIIGYPIVGSANLTNSGSAQSGVRSTTFTNSLSGFTGKLILINQGGGITVNLNTGASNLGNPATFTPDQISIGPGCTFVDNVGLTFNNANGGFTLAGNGTINSGGTTVIAEPITGAFTLTCGAGVIVLSNANNTYSGGTTISAGTLRMGVVNALPVTGSVTATTILDLNTNSTTIDGLNGAGTVDTVAGGTPTLTVGANGGSGSFTGTIQNSAGTLSLTKVGAGTQTFAGYNYSGLTLVTGGTLSLSSAGTLPVTPGDLTVSNGAALTVNASSGTALPAKNATVGVNGILNLTPTGAAFGMNAAGTLTMGNNATVNLSYGTVSANPAVAAINAAGIAAPGTGIVINISETGMKPGQFPVIKYAGTQLASLANFNLVMPLGVVAQLVNNTGEIDVNIISTPNHLAWNGLNGANWDINTTANWTNAANGTITVYQEYIIAGKSVGDGVTFDDTLTNSNPQPTNINLTTIVSPNPVTVNSTRPYRFAGVGGIAGSGTAAFYLLKTNTGSLTLLTSNSFGGGVYIGGGSVIITNDFSLGASSGVVTLNSGTLQVNGSTTNSARSFSVPAASTIGVAANVQAQFGGSITGAGGLAKTDNGTLTLAGSNAITGALTVSQGTLNTLGTNILAAVPVIGNIAFSNAVLNILGGVFQANNNGGSVSSSSLTIGGLAGTAGSVVMSSGTLTVNRELAVGSTDSGAFSQSGGTITIGGFIACGATADGGVFNQSGGTVNMTNSSATIGYGVTSSFGVMNLSGNAVFNMIGAGNGVWPGEVGNGALNVSGNAALTITNDGVALGRNTGTGTVNLNGGTITVNFVTNGPIAGTFNFNGGTLKANAASAAFTRGAANQTAFYIYNGGATIDDGGNAITFSRPLQAATGSGISAIALADGGSGYISPPIVNIVDDNGYGSNAMATAQVNPVSGTVTGIVITCPGSGWDPVNSSVDVTFTGGGATPTPPDIGVASFVANNGTGGLTKNGSGTLTMSGLKAIAGAVNVNAGTLSINTASTLNGATTVSNGATLSITQSGSATSSMGNLAFSGGAGAPGATLGLAITAANNQAVPFVNCGTLTLNGTNTISLAGFVQVGSIALIKSVGAIAGSGNITNLALPQGVVGSISTSFDGTHTTISANITSTGPGLVWTGTNSAAGLTNVWNINSAVNWLLGSTPTTYQQAIVPGDAVTFNDTGSGTVLVSNTVGPASLVISNNVRSYTFGGTGTITGPAGITKLGSGTAIVNLANNNYVGNTTVSNGTLQLGVATAISSSANLVVGSGGTLELAGFSPTAGELTGSGIIDNNSGLNPALTVGSSSGGTWNGTIKDHGAGGVTLHKVGSGTWFVGGTNYLNDGQPFSDQSLITAGTVIVTNGGLLSVSELQLQIANGAGQSASVVVAGGTLAVSNNVLSVGYGSTTASGTLTVNSGTVFHGGPGGGDFAAVPESIDVGAQGATGILTVNGGQVLNNSALYLGDGTGASGTLNLNGGLLQATSVLPNGTPTLSVAYFNGGTLQATTNSTSFLQVSCNVMGGGLILDDNGYTLGITAASISAGILNDGGFTKKGAGTVYLDTGSGYNGLTTVMNGTLAGIGSINGSVMVAPAGNLGAGDASSVGTFTIAKNLTLQGNATMRINKTGGTKTQDNIVVSGGITYGGVLTVNNITSDSTVLAVGDTFQLFSVTGSVTGNFTSVVGFGATYSFNPATGILTVLSTGPGVFTNPTGITGFKLNGANVVITATNGQAGGAYYLLQSTNVALKLSQWITVATNVVSANGNYTFTGTNVVAPGSKQQFYILSNTNYNH